MPCVDTELSVSFTHEGSTQTVAMTRMEVFAKHYEHSDAIPRCAYMGHSGASALFEGPELYKLYVDKLVVSAEPSSAAPASERDLTISRSYQVAEARLPDDQLAFCGHTTEHEKQHFSHPERSPRAISSRFTDYPDLPAAYRYVTPPPSPCLSSVRTIQINLVADYNFTQAYGSSNSAVLTEMAALTSYLSSSFTATANIAFQLGQTFIFPTATSGFNDPNSCVQSQPSVLLDAFTAWVNQQGTSYPVPAVWVLLTQCMNNGVVGLAYVGQACQSYNTGYASIIPNAGHLVFTHEVGHLMGASHDTSDNGGIMMPAAGYWDTFSQNSQNYFCSYISGSSIPSNCFVATGGTTASTASTAATTAAATTTAATTAATTAGTGSNSDILNVINAKRAQYNQPALTWSSNAESYAASAASSCNWGISWPATQTYTAYRSAATTNMGTTILSFVSNIVNNANYNCASDTCGSGVSSFNCAVFRSWMSSSTTAIGCSISVCPASTMTWGSPQQSWNFLACSSTPYAVYSSQTPFPSSSCPAGKEVLSEREASSQCPDLCANRYCGVQQGEDGCPDQVCGLGSCLTGATCSDEGQCVCTPITTCDMVGACVVTVDNCGNELDCTEGCNPAGPCTNPVNNSVCDGLSCGRKWNGCEWVSCGLVQEGQSCQNFQASTCDESCHASFGQCDPELGCVCKPGYEGDGFSCVPQTEANIIDALCSGVQWEAAFGDAASFLAGGGQTSNDDLDCAFYHSASSESHANNGPTDGILFTSFSFNTGADTLWGASITRDNAYGPVGLLYASGSNLIQFWHNGGGKYLLQATKGDKVFRKTVTQGTWSAEDTKTLTLILRVDGTVVPSIDNQTFNAYQLPSGFDLANNNNQVGLLAGVGADATFSGLQLLTTARVTFSIFGDWSETEIENLLTQLLGVAASQITNIDVAYDSGVTTVTLDISGASQSSSQKRLAKSTVARAAVVANPASAASLATQLESWLAASSAVRGGFVGASPALAQGAAPATLSAAGGGSGLSAGAIVGIVIGSVAGAALLGGVVIYALTAGSSSNDDVDEDNTAPARPKSWRQTLRISWHPRKAPRGGVNLDPGSNDKHRSLTARNPNIADQYS